MATIKEVAKHAGVSVATVSRVLNASGYVSEELKQRVREAAKALNYQPSRVAKSLRHQKTNTIGVLVPQLDLPFFSALTFAIQQSLSDDEYFTLVGSTMENARQEAAYIDMMIGQRVDGLIMVPTGHDATNIQRLVDFGIPTVIVDRDISGFPQLDRVLCDNEEGAYYAAQHLIQLGHREVCVVGGPQYSLPIQKRLHGIKRAFEEADLSLADDHIFIEAGGQFDLGHNLAQRILQSSLKPSAIFALGDVMAVGVIHAADEAGIDLPDSLSIVGFDDIPMAAYILPALTTVMQPIYDMGRAAVAILLERIGEPDRKTQRLELSPELIVRQSTAPVH